MSDAISDARVPLAVLHAEPDLVPARGGRRSIVLHRLLAVADAVSGLAAGTVGALVAGVPAGGAVALGATCTLILPFLAFACGLYAADCATIPVVLSGRGAH